MTKTTLRLIIGCIVLVAIIFLQRGCYNRQLDKAHDETATLQMQHRKLEATINRNGEIIRYKDAVIFAREDAISELDDTIFALKERQSKTIAFYQHALEVNIQHDTVPYVKVVPLPMHITDEFARGNMLLLPASVEKQTPYYGIRGTVTHEGFVIDSLGLTDTISGRFVRIKNGLLKPASIQYQIANTNPYVTFNTGMSAIYQPPKKGWIGRAAVTIGLFGVGILTGIIISHQ